MKVLDFGLAKLIERPAAEATISGVDTKPGMVIGTAAYMSPEQAEGRPVDARSDIFSFGVVLYEMLTGRRPFAGSSTHVGAHHRDPARSASRRAERAARGPADVEAIVERALAKNPAARYPDGAAMRADLAAAHARLTRPAGCRWRRPACSCRSRSLLLAAAGFGVWQTSADAAGPWARLEAIPEIERLQIERPDDACGPARAATEPLAPDEIAARASGWLAFDHRHRAGWRERRDEELPGHRAATGSRSVRRRSRCRLPFGYYRVRVRSPVTRRSK